MHLRVGGGAVCEAVEDGFDDAVAAHSHEREGLFCVGSDAFEEPVANHSMAAMEADLDVFDGEIESVRCFRGAEFFDVAQHDDGAVVLGQIEHGLLQKLSQLCAGGGLFGVGRFVDICIEISPSNSVTSTS